MVLRIAIVTGVNWPLRLATEGIGFEDLLQDELATTIEI